MLIGETDMARYSVITFIIVSFVVFSSGGVPPSAWGESYDQKSHACKSECLRVYRDGIAACNKMEWSGGRWHPGVRDPGCGTAADKAKRRCFDNCGG
jgi:hypothetical protein